VCATADAAADVAPVLRAAGRLDVCIELAPPGAPERAALLAARLRECGASCQDEDIQVTGPPWPRLHPCRLRHCCRDVRACMGALQSSGHSEQQAHRAVRSSGAADAHAGCHVVAGSHAASARRCERQAGPSLWRQAVAAEAEGYDAGDLGLVVDRALHAALRRQLALAPGSTTPKNGTRQT